MNAARNSGLADSPFFMKDESESKTETKQEPSSEEPMLAAKDSALPESQHAGYPEFGSPDSRQSQDHRQPLSQSSDKPESRTPRLPEIHGYNVRKYDQLRRIDLRLTGKQKRYLDDLFEDIKQDIPEGDRSDPEYRQVTKSSIIRAVLEILRQMQITVDASEFRNEGDLLLALFEALCKRLTESRTTALPVSRSSAVPENRSPEEE